MVDDNGILAHCCHIKGACLPAYVLTDSVLIEVVLICMMYLHGLVDFLPFTEKTRTKRERKKASK